MPKGARSPPQLRFFLDLLGTAREKGLGRAQWEGLYINENFQAWTQREWLAKYLEAIIHFSLDSLSFRVKRQG